METTNNSSNLNTYISSVECNNSENNNSFSIKLIINTIYELKEKFLIRITEGQSSKNSIAQKVVINSDYYMHFDDLVFKSDKNYYVWLFKVYGSIEEISTIQSVPIITSTPNLDSVSYILDMEIVKKNGYNYNSNSTGITKINQKRGDFSNISFDLIYNREEGGDEYTFLIPHDKSPKVDMYSVTPKQSWKFDMLSLQWSRQIYNYIKGKTRGKENYGKTLSFGPYSETVDYKYVFPKLKAPDGENLFSVSRNNELTLNWYVQSSENGQLNNVCREFDCNLYVNDEIEHVPYNSGLITYPLPDDVPLLSISACFVYDFNHFGEKVRKTIILIVPDITEIECYIKEDSFSLDVSWDTKVEVSEIQQIKIVVRSGDSVIREEYCNLHDGKTLLENLNLSSEKNYIVEASYYIKDKDGVESEGKMSPSIAIIHKYPKDFTIEYLSTNDLDLTLNGEYYLVANWENNLLLNDEYVEIEYTDNQHKTAIKKPDPSTTPPLQINDDTIIEAKIRKRTTNSIGPWSNEVTVPHIGISKYDFDYAGRLLKVNTIISEIETQTNEFEYDDRGNILSKEVIQNKKEQVTLKNEK